MKKPFLSKEELELETQYKEAIKELELKLKDEIKSEYQIYDAEYTRLEEKFSTVDKKTDPGFLAAEKELDDKYIKISTAIGEKYAELNNKLFIKFFNSVAELHYKNKLR